MSKPHSTADGPPDGSAMDKDADNAVHEFRIAKASPRRDLVWRNLSGGWPVKLARTGEGKGGGVQLRVIPLHLRSVPSGQELGGIASPPGARGARGPDQWRAGV